MNISGKQNKGKVITYKPAVQLVLGDRYERYVKKIEKVLEKPENYIITEFDEVTGEMNIGLYKELVYKLTSTIFKVKFASLGEKLESSFIKFESLTLRKQCYVLNEILKII